MELERVSGHSEQRWFLDETPPPPPFPAIIPKSLHQDLWCISLHKVDLNDHQSWLQKKLICPIHPMGS